MFKVVQPYYCLCLSWLTILMNFGMTMIASTPVAKPNCPIRCGNVTIPYPFGVGLDGGCSLTDAYNINCDTAYDPPKPLLGTTNIEVMDISDTGQMRIRNSVATRCYQGGQMISSSNLSFEKISLTSNLPIMFSDTANRFTVVGCDDNVVIEGSIGRNFTTGCLSVCSRPEEVRNGSCMNIGCCQIDIPMGVKMFSTTVSSMNNHTNVSDFNSCSHVFLAENERFSFSLADLSDSDMLRSRIEDHVPIVLEWFVGLNRSCRQAKANRTSYACQENTDCIDFDNAGYRCRCLPNYEGNPYLNPGCTDVDECVDSSDNNCSNICINIPGSYKCSCPKGHRGDGLKNGSGCTSDPSQLAMRLSLGMSFGFLFLLMILCCIYFSIRRKKFMKMREKFFEQNGGLLLKQQLSENGGSIDVSKIFSADELKVATNNYNDDRILGQGGYGTVYKGILKDGREVAIKKSKLADQSQVDQFINEVVILTQINHRNVVKLLGCCLESEVPLLVYEFISNKTLFEHINKNKGMTSWLTWANCIRIAAEAVDALAYLHSAASIPIIHRDVKSTNILLDESYTAKISDFGASRLVPIDQTQVTTLVQGTLGYLDPEYFHTSQLTDKSDVYSFGVVLAELLTKEKPLSFIRRTEERNLATYFVLAMKEDRLMEIVDRQLLREASKEQIVAMANLVKKCLNVMGEERPTMKEVALELEGLRKNNSHPWAKQNYYEETTDLKVEQDLYPVHSNSHTGSTSTIEYSGLNSMEMSLISEMNHPR